MSQDYQTRQWFTEEGNLSGPIRTGHNQHTHMATLANPSSTQGFLVFIRHPELNSRDVIPSSTRGMYVLNPYPELNSRDMFRAQLKEPSNLTFEASPKAL